MSRVYRLSALLLLVACGDATPDIPDVGVPDGGVVPDACGAMPCVLTPGARGQDFLAPEGDEDIYVFEVPAAGRIIDLAVFSEATFTPIQLEVVLTDPNGVAVSNVRAAAGQRPQRVEVQEVAEMVGTYRVTVRDVGSDSADRRNPYFVELALLDDEDTNEPNDVESMATPLTLGAAARGKIATQGDVDWFSVQLAAGRRAQIQVSVAGLGPVRHQWTLLDPNGVQIATDLEPTTDVAWGDQVRKVGATGGRFLLRVEDDGRDGQQASRRLYTVRVDELPEPDAAEGLAGNDQPQDATVLTAGTPARGFIAATGDVDWFAIDVPTASPAQPQIVAATARVGAATAVDLQMTLFESDGTTLICDQRDGDACRAFRFVRDGSAGPTQLSTAHVVTQPGRYLVAIRDLQDDEYDEQIEFELQVDLPADPDRNENYQPSGRAAAVVVPAATATTGMVIQYEWVEGHISYANDSDWYRFDIPGPVEASPGQNGDWLVRLELQMPSPTPVELQAFFFGPDGSDRERYRGLGQRCRQPSPDDPDVCQWPDSENGLAVDFETTVGSMMGECFVVFREVTGAGPHYWRLTDLALASMTTGDGGDDFDLGPNGRYRLRMSITSGCPGNSACAGRFLRNGQDLCGRP